MVDLTVVIATYNRRRLLVRCLESLRRQSLPADKFDVVVVVDGSTDGTTEMLEESSDMTNLRIVFQDNAGQPVALNRGLAAAGGEYVLFIDDDIVLDPDCLANHLDAQRRAGGAAAIGYLAIRLAPEADGFTRWFARWWESHYHRLESRGQGEWFDCFSGNLSVPIASLREVGGFATDMARGWDLELGYRLQQKGLPITYVPGARGRQDYLKSGDDLLADSVQQGATAPEMYRRHPAMLPHLSLASFGAPNWRNAMLRRILLGSRLPPRAVARLGVLAPNDRWQDVWYDFVYLYAYWYGVRHTVPDRDFWARLTSSTPILMYHGFGYKGEQETRYVVPGDVFLKQMMYLKRRGFTVLSLDEYLRHRAEHRLPPARSVIITVDDGYLDNVRVAVPILRRLGFPATIFITTGGLGSTNSWDADTELSGRQFMSQDDVRELLQQGIQVGAHTRHHPALPRLDETAIQDEVAGSKEDLEDTLQAPVLSFAYPYGLFNKACEAAVERAGFLGACTVRTGLNTAATPRFALRRVEIPGTIAFPRFLLALWIGRTHVSEVKPRPRERSHDVLPAYVKKAMAIRLLRGSPRP